MMTFLFEDLGTDGADESRLGGNDVPSTSPHAFEPAASRLFDALFPQA